MGKLTDEHKWILFSDHDLDMSLNRVAIYIASMREGMFSKKTPESKFKALVVGLILDGKIEAAFELLARHYRTDLPKLEVGMPKRHKRNAFGCYAAKSQTIYVLDSSVLTQPFVVLHEFYHHMRTSTDLKHKGTEKYASDFARDFIQAYNSMHICQE